MEQYRLLKGCLIVALVFSAYAGSARGYWTEMLAKDAEHQWDRAAERDRINYEKAARVWPILQKMIKEKNEEIERERAEKSKSHWLLGSTLSLLVIVPIGAYFVIRTRKRRSQAKSSGKNHPTLPGGDDCE